MNQTSLPTGAFPCKKNDLRDWLEQEHPSFVGTFEIHHGRVRDGLVGYAFDGYIKPEKVEGTTYLVGWFMGRFSK